MNIAPSIRKLLDNETTIHEAQIRALFQTLDRKFGLRGASVPVSYTHLAIMQAVNTVLIIFFFI